MQEDTINHDADLSAFTNTERPEVKLGWSERTFAITGKVAAIASVSALLLGVGVGAASSGSRPVEAPEPEVVTVEKVVTNQQAINACRDKVEALDGVIILLAATTLEVNTIVSELSDHAIAVLLGDTSNRRVAMIEDTVERYETVNVGIEMATTQRTNANAMTC